jgi:glycerol-3-phosphate dehydrogenase
VASSALDLRDREGLFKELSTAHFDLLVIGGGITGAGIARDAALRGLHVALVEAQDFASGTSSRSTKLVHGGLRYLAQGDINLVKESATERAVLENLAPHLAQTQRFLLPVTSKAAQLKFRTGLWGYEKLGRVAEIDTHQVRSLKQINELEPALNTQGWHSGITYGECITEDARLTTANIRSAYAVGAKVINYCKVIGFLNNSADRISGVRVKDTLTDLSTSEEFSIKAKVIVNAAGPWVDAISKLGNEKNPAKLQLTKGVHIVVPHKRLPLNKPLIATARDKRTLFIIPKDDITYIGTTDTFYSSTDYWPKANVTDIDYLLDTANRASKAQNLRHEDVISLWTGIRPLIAEEGKSPSEISRKDETWESAEGLISIAGGKLTAYRRMAERVVDLVETKLGKNPSLCTSAHETLPGGDQTPHMLRQDALFENIDDTSRDRLIRNYGSEALNLLGTRSGFNSAQLNSTLLNSTDIISAEAEQAVLKEGALTLEDYWIRRSGRSLFDVDAGLNTLEVAASKMADLLNWSEEQKRREIDHCQSVHMDRMDWRASEQDTAA